MKSPGCSICPLARSLFLWQDPWRVSLAPMDGDTYDASRISSLRSRASPCGRWRAFAGSRGAGRHAPLRVLVLPGRKQEMEEAIVDFVRLHRGNLDPLLPPAEWTARFAQGAARGNCLCSATVVEPVVSKSLTWRQARRWRCVWLRRMAAGSHYRVRASLSRPTFHSVPVSFPEPSLTPGAVATVDRDQVCRSAPPKNRSRAGVAPTRGF